MALDGLRLTLRRGVGRKILGLFLLAGLVPLVITGILAYLEIGRSVTEEVEKTLRANAKHYGYGLLGRFQTASAAAEEAIRVYEELGREQLAEFDFLLQPFRSISRVDDAGKVRALYGNVAGLEMSELAATPLTERNRGLVTLADGNSARFVLVFARPGGSGRYVFEVRGTAIWIDNDELPYGTDYCLSTAQGIAVHCTSEQAFDPAALRLSDDYVVIDWELFLGGEFNAPSLHITAFQSRTHALQASADFQRILIPALALVVLLVGILSFNLVGQSLDPLRKLSGAVEDFASGDLSRRVSIHSEDEFEALGDMFNTMAGRIGQQLSTLQVMSEIDRLILRGGGFDAVSTSLLRHVVINEGFVAAGLVAADTDSPHRARMVSLHDGKFKLEQIPMALDLDHPWCQAGQVELAEDDLQFAPYARSFAALGMTHVVVLPVVLQEILKGILLLASTEAIDTHSEGAERCADLAGRLAVALESVERDEALYRQAHFDDLTGLPNRQLLKDRLEAQMAHARKENRSGALLFLDLDRFKEINDIYGHSIGDLVLMQAAERIVQVSRDNDTVARLGGDEFVVVMPRVANDEIVRSVAARLLDRLTESFTVDGVDHYLGASIGIVMFPADGTTVETLLKNADAAMYRAKDAGRARFEFFSQDLNAESRRKIGLERDLRAAIDERKLEVFYQPQFFCATDEIAGAEALLRWHHDSEGYVSPAEFIPLAEETGLIVDIGRDVIRQVCEDLRSMLDKGLHPGVVSINVSTRQLRDTQFIADVLEPLHRFDIHPGYIQLEVTETALAQNRDTVLDILNRLRGDGVRVAIDDFGTGYSSLSYLQQLPFDVIKIDKSFVARIGAGDPSDNICRTIIKMAAELGKKSVAEGVETEAQLHFLQGSGCDVIQGYLRSMPLAYPDFMSFVQKLDYHTQRRRALEIVGT